MSGHNIDTMSLGKGFISRWFVNTGIDYTLSRSERLSFVGIWGLFQKSIKTDFEPLKKMLERHSSVHSTKIFATRKYLLLTQRHKGVFYPSPSPKYWTKFGSSYKPWHSLMHNRGNYLRHCKYILNANTQRMLINVGESWYCGSYLPKVISRIIIWNLFQVTHISPAQVHLWKAYPCQIGELLCK